MNALMVPTPLDRERDVLDAATKLRSVSDELERKSVELVQASSHAVSEWTGNAAFQFKVAEEQAHTALQTMIAAHRAHAAAQESYAARLAHARSEADGALRALRAHQVAYERDIRNQLQALHNEAQRKFDDAKRHLANAGHDLSHLNVVGAVSETAQAATSAFQGLADSAVEELLSHLSAWQPHVPEPELLAMRPGIDKVVLLSFETLYNDLVALGNFLASIALEAFADVLSVMGLTSAARAVHTVESEFITQAVNAINAAAQAFYELERTAVALAEEMAWRVIEGFDKVWTFKDQLSGWISAAELGVLRLVDPVHQGRRIPNPELMDQAASDKFFSDRNTQRAVDLRRMMAQDAYSDTGVTIKGWTRESVPGPDGGYAVIYTNNATGEIVVAFRGSEPNDGRDWNNDAQDSLGMRTNQGTWAVWLAQKVHSDHPGVHIEFTGHSLGGSLAAQASLATGDTATTFNAAGVGDGNYQHAIDAHGGVADESHITNYSTPYDVLTNAQPEFGARPAAGSQVTLPGQHHDVEPGVRNIIHGVSEMIDAHGLDDFNWDSSGFQKADQDTEDWWKDYKHA